MLKEFILIKKSNQICDKIPSNVKSKECLLRHPKDCKDWMEDTRDCVRGNVCKYLHISSKKGLHIKSNYHDTKIEIINEKPDDETVHVLKEAIAAKEEDIERLDDKISKLITKNEVVIEENNRLQRIMKNMDHEIKVLRSWTTKTCRPVILEGA